MKFILNPAIRIGPNTDRVQMVRMDREAIHSNIQGSYRQHCFCFANETILFSHILEHRLRKS